MIEFIVGDAFKTTKTADHIITDPPYTAYVHARLLAGKKKSVGADAYVKEIACTFDELPPAAEWLPGLNALAKRWAMYFCSVEQLGEYQAADRGHWIRSGIYCKMRAMPQMTGDRPGNRCEGLSIFHSTGKKRWNGKGTHAFWRAMPQNRKDTEHPTSKPLLLCMRLIEQFTDPGEVILDPFVGTGNILLAADLLGRHGFGVDLNSEYVAIAQRRLETLDRDKWLKKYEEYRDKAN